MIPYLICFILPASVLLFSKSRVKNKKMLILILLPAAFLIAFKGESIGADTVTYNNAFRAMVNGNFWQIRDYNRIELGFTGLIWLLSKMTSNPQIQYIVLAIFFFVTFYYFLYRSTENYPVFLLLFYGLNVFSFFLTGLRQSFALLICLWAYDQAHKKHLFRFIICVGLAFLFHKSAIAFLIIYFCVRRNFKKIDIFYYALFFILVIIFNKYIFSIGGELFDINYGIEFVANGYIMFSIIAIITVLSFVFYRELKKNNQFNAALISLNAMCMAFWILRLFSRTAERITLYFMPFTILIVCELLKLVRKETGRIILSFGMIAAVGFLFVYRLYALGLIPFVFFWN